MGSSRSPAELASKLRNAGGAIDGAAKDGVAKAALMVKTNVVAEMRGVTRLRGVGKRGAKVGVRYDIKGTGNPTALIRMTGPAQLLERDTRPHEIKPRGKKKAINIPGIGPRASAHHPGTKGKHPWARGLARSLPKVGEVMRREQAESLRRFFG